MHNQLFARKSLAQLLEEMAGENRLRRVLGPVQLSSLGVGAIIGAGIFVATGAAARNVAGPALMASYVVAGITCIFRALLRQFASMVPVAGGHLRLRDDGRLFAWMIGWDLILEVRWGGDGRHGWSRILSERPGEVRPAVSTGLAGPRSSTTPPQASSSGRRESSTFRRSWLWPWSRSSS